MKKVKYHFEVSEWPLIVLTLFIAILITELV